MLAIKQLERLGADASLNTAQFKEQFGLATGMPPRSFYQSKQWCIIIPDEDEQLGRRHQFIHNCK